MKIPRQIVPLVAAIGLLATGSAASVVIDMPARPATDPASAAPGAATADVSLGAVALMRYSQARTGTYDVYGPSAWGYGSGYGYGYGWPWGCGWGGWRPWGCGGYRIYTTPQAYYGSSWYYGACARPALIGWW